MRAIGGGRFLVALAVVAVLALGAPVAAQPQTVRLEPERTEIAFTLGATGHTVEGTMRLTSGALSFDLATGEASGELLLDARRTETANRKRDRKMHETVLLTADHPEIRFEARGIRGRLPEADSSTSEVQVDGDIVLLGRSHPVTLTAAVQRDGTDLVLDCSFVVPYVAWGLRDPSAFVLRVAKEVEVRVRARATLDPALD